MGYRKIVVGTDGSPTANVARDVAIRLAKRFRAKLVLVSAYEEPLTTRERAEEVLSEALEAAKKAKVDAIAALQNAPPADLIISVAEEQKADLLVVGNKGMGNPSRFRLGSVPDRTAYFAPCDLLIFDTTGFLESGGKGQPGRFGHVLVATDGSPTAAEATRKAFDMASLMDAKVTLVYVGDPIIGAIKLEESARTAPDGVEVEQKITEGDPAEQICQLAEAQGVDLIVVGNKGMSGARRFLLGSVPNKVAHYAPTNVLIAKTVERTVEELEPGHGAVLEYQGRTMAVYKDESGRITSLPPRCTHMGCTVDWNEADKTWDCPCHGSRYSRDGKVIQGPAPRGLDGSEAAPSTEEVATSGVGHGLTRSHRTEHFIVVGASLTGANAAATLRDEGFEGNLVLIGAEAHYPYERPPLSKAFLRGEVPFEDALVRPPAYYKDTDIKTRFGMTVLSVDAGQRAVTLADGEILRYDRLLIATGARNRRFPIPGLDLPGVYDLRTVGDAERIRSEMAPGRKVVVSGLGFIGSEVAASLRRRGLEVTAIDGLRAPLERVLGLEIGEVIAGIHRDQGVELIFEDRVAAFEGGTRVERVVTSQGRTIECDFAVVGLGVEPNVDLLAGTGVKLDNGVVVDELCRTNVDGVYAAGDVANHYHPVFDRHIRIEHWQNAILHGRAAGLSMLDKGQPYDEIHWFWSDQYDHNLQYAGFHTDWDDLVVRGSFEDRNFTAFYMKDGRVLAVVALNRGPDVHRSIPIIKAAGHVDPARLREEETDLRVLA
jgi:3-phenylpropionate/trans-cinnamate dioxygenase ferredoxin reductase component